MADGSVSPKSGRKSGAQVGGAKVVHPKNKLNDLTSIEWLPETVSVWTQRGIGANHPDAAIEREHPAPFSFTDVARLVKFFTKRGDVVLDPFVGVGSTLKACALEGRRGIGFELSKKYVTLARRRLKEELRDVSRTDTHKVFLGDARTLVRRLEDNSIDFIVTSPPYWNILHKKDHKVEQDRISKSLDTRYGDDPRDLGNISSYDEFLGQLAEILGACARPLKHGKYMAVVVSDFRDKSSYVMFHSDIARVLHPFGLHLRGLTVLYQRHKRVFPYGYPYAFVPNIHNQFILLLQNVK